jgi:hypothetical protein
MNGLIVYTNTPGSLKMLGALCADYHGLMRWEAGRIGIWERDGWMMISKFALDSMVRRPVGIGCLESYALRSRG